MATVSIKKGNKTYILSSSGEVVNQNGQSSLKFWKGDLTAYGALNSLSPDTVYIIEQYAQSAT